MALKAGIVGLPNVGKSTLFNAITKQNILAANYPFATIDPNVGMVVVPDSRLEVLENMYFPERTIPTTYEFTDIAGLVKGASHGEGLGNKFLSHIKDVDAIVEVVRCFVNSDIIHVEGDVNPIRDIEIINVELIFTDLDIINNRLDKIEKKAITTKDKDALIECDLLNKCKNALEQNIALRRLEFSKEEDLLLRGYNFLTIKPIIYCTNVEESDVQDGNQYTKLVQEYAVKENSAMVIISAKLESELSELNEEDKKLFLKDLGINYSGLDKLIFATYDLLGLETFFTVGKDEVRAWTFKKGMKAPDCAGIIHTDFKRGFIKAEVMSFSDLDLYKDEKKVKEAGKLRIEGKEYVMQDGDICLFRFNV